MRSRCTPLAVLASRAWDGRADRQRCTGADPVAEIEHFLGLWALRFLMLRWRSPRLRHLTGQSVLVRFRRMLGLYAFLLCVGALLRLPRPGPARVLDADLRGDREAPYITVGFAAWLLLVPLAITSTTGWIRRLGRNWARLHKLVYAIGVLAVLHFWWLVKSDVREPALYAAILATLLGWRAWKKWTSVRAVRAPVSAARRTAGSR
jgi:sulfoxide reductase heme-binding subunit YedZ